MAGSRTRLIAVAAAGMLSSVALAACGGGGSSTATSGSSGASGAAGAGQVSASDYVASVCSAVGDYKSTLQAEQASVQQDLAGQGSDVGAVKDELGKFISEMGSATEQVATNVKDAGTPDVPNGDQIASQLNSRLDQLTTAVQGAQDKVNALPTSSPEAFGSAVQSFTTSFHQQTEQISQLDLTDSGSPELKQAAEQNPDCKSLKSG